MQSHIEQNKSFLNINNQSISIETSNQNSVQENDKKPYNSIRFTQNDPLITVQSESQLCDSCLHLKALVELSNSKSKQQL